MIRATQERVMLSLVTLLKAHKVNAITIDEVVELWCSSNHGTRWTIPRPQINRVPAKIYRQKSR